MPLYEYVCAQCGTFFEYWMRSAGALEAVVCPHCQSQEVSKKFSTFGMKGSAGGSSVSTGDSCTTGGG
ncbi:MAG: zinc ribbon domain-containing protein [Chloroflexi bacterium]|nr:zinc ribbon domain-containing protein [Chloroflexota bacterium]